MSNRCISDSKRESYQQFSSRLPHAFPCKRAIVVSSVKQVMDAKQVKSPWATEVSAEKLLVSAIRKYFVF